MPTRVFIGKTLHSSGALCGAVYPATVTNCDVIKGFDTLAECCAEVTWGGSPEAPTGFSTSASVSAYVTLDFTTGTTLYAVDGAGQTTYNIICDSTSPASVTACDAGGMKRICNCGGQYFYSTANHKAYKIDLSTGKILDTFDCSSPTHTPTTTFSHTPSATSSISHTPSSTLSYTPSVTSSISHTPSSTLSYTPTMSYTPTATVISDCDYTIEVSILQDAPGEAGDYDLGVRSFLGCDGVDAYVEGSAGNTASWSRTTASGTAVLKKSERVEPVGSKYRDKIITEDGKHFNDRRKFKLYHWDTTGGSASSTLSGTNVKITNHHPSQAINVLYDGTEYQIAAGATFSRDGWIVAAGVSGGGSGAGRVIVVDGCPSCGTWTATPTITHTTSETPSHTLSISHTSSATSSNTYTPTITSTASYTPTPTVTARLNFTPTFTSTASNTPSSTLSYTPSNTYTPTITPSVTSSISHTSSNTYTPTVTLSHTSTPSSTISHTSSISHTPSITSSISHTPSMTSSISHTPSVTSSISHTPSFTSTNSYTPTVTATSVASQFRYWIKISSQDDATFPPFQNWGGGHGAEGGGGEEGVGAWRACSQGPWRTVECVGGCDNMSTGSSIYYDKSGTFGVGTQLFKEQNSVFGGTTNWQNPGGRTDGYYKVDSAQKAGVANRVIKVDVAGKITWVAGCPQHSQTATFSYTPTITSSISHTPSATSSISHTPSVTSSISHTPSSTLSYTPSNTYTPTVTDTHTPSVTSSISHTPSHTISHTSSLTHTPTTTHIDPKLNDPFCMVVYQPCSAIAKNLQINEIPSQTSEGLLSFCISADNHNTNQLAAVGKEGLKFDKGGGDVCWSLVHRFRGADQLPVFTYKDTGDLMVFGVKNDDQGTLDAFNNKGLGTPSGWQRQYGGYKVSELQSGWGAMYSVAWSSLYDARTVKSKVSDWGEQFDTCKECSGAGGEAAVTLELSAVSASTLTTDFGNTRFNNSNQSPPITNSDVLLDSWLTNGPDILKNSQMKFTIYNNNPVIDKFNAIKIGSYDFELWWVDAAGKKNYISAETDEFRTRTDKNPMHIVDDKSSPPLDSHCVIGGGKMDSGNTKSRGLNNSSDSDFGLSRPYAPDNVAHVSSVVPSSLFDPIAARSSSENVFRSLTTKSTVEFTLELNEIQASNSRISSSNKTPDWKELCPRYLVKGKYKIPDYDYIIKPISVPSIYGGGQITRSTSMAKTIDLGVIDDKATAIVNGLSLALEMENRGIGSIVFGRKSWKLEYMNTEQESQQIDQGLLSLIMEENIGEHGKYTWADRLQWDADTQKYGYSIHGGNGKVNENNLRVNPMNFKLGLDVDKNELPNEKKVAAPGTYGIEIVYGLVNVGGAGEGWLFNLPVDIEELQDTFTLSIVWSFPSAFYQTPKPPRPPRRPRRRR